jgi:hypothetical protein
MQAVLAVRGVECELVSERDSLIYSENTGNFIESGLRGDRRSADSRVDLRSWN